MSTQTALYQPYFTYLQSLNFHFPDTWVMECVDYYKSNNSNVSVEFLKSSVKQQWLLVDLRELKVPSLPPDLKSKEKAMLNGKYAVQVESMIDCGESCYSQFQKLQKINTENIEATKEFSEWNIKSNRCLTFMMSDGVQEIQAMEYQPIKKIRTNDPELLPGFKMVIVGPVECRKGMILLKDENVRVCGGEVDTLTTSNNLKSILIEKLQLDEAYYPDNTNLASLEDNPVHEIMDDDMQLADNQFHEGHVESLLSQNDDLFLSLPMETEILGQQPNSKSSMTTTNDLTEVDLFIEPSNDWNEDAVTSFREASSHKKHSLPQEDIVTSTQKRPSLDPDLENSETEPYEWNLTGKAATDFTDFSESHEGTCASTSRIKRPVQTKLSSFFRNNDFSLHNVSRTSANPSGPLFVSDVPFVYLKQIMSSDLSKDIFTIKGIIIGLRNKITIENDKFSLKANITDGSAYADVDFSSEILEELLGFSPCEMIEMMRARQGNTAVAQRVKKTFSQTQEKLISLNCLLKIKFFKNGNNPLVLFLEEVTIHHLNALRERLLKQM